MEYILIRQSLFVRIDRNDELSVVNCTGLFNEKRRQWYPLVSDFTIVKAASHCEFTIENPFKLEI